MRAIVALSFIIIIAQCTALWYLPGVSPVNFMPNDKVSLFVNKLTSSETQIPFRYYDLKVCRPENPIADDENLGEILRGDTIESSLFEIPAKQNVSCRVLCSLDYTPEEIGVFYDYIIQEYQVHWIVDNMPAATPKLYDGNVIYERGFPLGAKGDDMKDEGGEDEKVYLFNHFNLRFLYHENPNQYKGLRIVGFEVQPESIRHSTFDKSDPDSYPKTCTQSSRPPLHPVDPLAPDTVVWTYSITWVPSSIEWSDRWVRYLSSPDSDTHWFGVLNSFSVVLFLSALVAIIFVRTVRADVRKYNLDFEGAEESGWKLVHGDIFRAPQKPMLLAALIGSGVQVSGSLAVTLLFAMLGFLSPASRGMLLTAALVLFVLMGLFGGYFAVRQYKVMKGLRWKRCVFVTALALPSVIFFFFFVVNECLQDAHSSGAIPVGTMFGVLAMWLGISLPAVFFGGYLAFRKPTSVQPVATNDIPREIPPSTWYNEPIVSILMGGTFPFGVICFELYFVLAAVWGYQFYYIFGFLFIVFILLIVTCAEISIILTYWQIGKEDYEWWWRSFLRTGSTALYIFFFAYVYFFARLNIFNPLSAFIYFAYTIIMCSLAFVFTGAIGYFSAYFFLRKIFSAVKVD